MYFLIIYHIFRADDLGCKYCNMKYSTHLWMVWILHNSVCYVTISHYRKVFVSSWPKSRVVSISVLGCGSMIPGFRFEACISNKLHFATRYLRLVFTKRTVAIEGFYYFGTRLVPMTRFKNGTQEGSTQANSWVPIFALYWKTLQASMLV